MKYARRRRVNAVIGQALLTNEVLLRRLRRRIMARLRRNYRRVPLRTILKLVREELEQFASGQLAHSLSDTILASWVTGLDVTSKRLPKKLLKAVVDRRGTVILPPEGLSRSEAKQAENLPTIVLPGFGDIAADRQPLIKFPRIEAAARDLADRQLLTKPQFDALEATSKVKAFTVAGRQNQKTLRRISDVLSESLSEGTSLRAFQKRMEDELLQDSFLSGAHLENVFRTNVQTAFSAGQQELLNDPIVKAAFPFIQYRAIDDDRTRDNHWAGEELGLNGTGVYWADDPLWDRFTPPNGYNCRCSVIPLTVRQAARRGVKVAQTWLRTGKAPTRRRFFAGNESLIPDPGFEARPGI